MLAIFTLVYMRSFALGSAAWGGVAQRRGIGLTLIYSGIGTIGSVVFVQLARLPDSTADLSPWNHWRMPVIVKEVGPNLLEGPVLVTIEYSVASGQETEFIEAIRQYARTRRRDGAYRWGIYRDTEVANRFVEIFLASGGSKRVFLVGHSLSGRSDIDFEMVLNPENRIGRGFRGWTSLGCDQPSSANSRTTNSLRMFFCKPGMTTSARQSSIAPR